MGEAQASFKQDIEFYQKHLDRVSRSFAFCIKQLNGEFRAQVGLSYLVFRILDTIEDAPWETFSEQKKAFDHFNEIMKTPEFFQRPGANSDYLEWLALFPKDIPESEMVLLKEGQRVFSDVHKQPEQVRQHIQNCSINMSRGMEFYACRAQDRPLRLKDIKDVNRYCFFVAGIVGELLEGLFLNAHPEEKNPQGLTKAFHFGLFLQKVNILKDQLSDEEEGRFLVPERDLIKKSLVDNGRNALDYILSLPKEAVSYRLFCAWSLFIGLASLPFIEQSFESKKFFKLPRIKTQLLIEKVRGIIKNNDRLQSLFSELLEGSRFSASQPQSVESQVQEFPEFTNLYSGQLAPADIKKLGLI